MSIYKVTLIVLSATFFTGCVNNHVIKDPTNKLEVGEKIYEKKSEFGEDTFYGPKISKDFGNVLVGDWLNVQLAKDSSGKYYLIIFNKYGGNWKFLESVTTLEKETIPLQNLDQKVDSCSATCYYDEFGVAVINKEKYLAGNKDFKIRINSKRGKEMVVLFPKEYIQALVEK